MDQVTASMLAPAPFLAGLLPDGIVTAQMACTPGLEPPHPDAMRPGVRRTQFAAGRWCAHAALRRFGIMDFPLRRQDDGAPLWPDGITGSISHTDTVAVAAACRIEPGLTGLGLDIEDAGRVTPDLWRKIFTPQERQRLAGTPRPDRTAAIGFSAKEAFFKAQWPLMRAKLGFTDIDCTIDDDGFDITVPEKSLGPFRGTWRLDGGMVVTAILLR